MFRIILILFITVVHLVFAQNEKTSNQDNQEMNTPPSLELRLIPSGRLFRPLIANTFEARVGMMGYLDQKQFRLDIGNSIDLFGLTINTAQEKHEFTAGADFFTYTLLQKEEGFHFPTDAVDYLFGVNLNYSQALGGNFLAARFRISHISAHFLDGHYDGTAGRWKDRDPQAYSREFFDLVISYEISLMRYYIGASYLFHVDPSWLHRTAFQAGAELTSGEYIHKNIMAYAAIDVKLINISGYAAVNTLQLGVRFGQMKGPALDLFVTYFSGNSTSGEYYDVKIHYWALGFLINF